MINSNDTVDIYGQQLRREFDSMKYNPTERKKIHAKLMACHKNWKQSF